MFSPKDPGESWKEGKLEEGFAREVNREESMMWTWRGFLDGVMSQLGEFNFQYYWILFTCKK